MPVRPVFVMKIILLEGIHPAAGCWLKSKGFQVEKGPASCPSLGELKKKKPVGLGIRSRTQITSSLLSSLPSLRVVGAFCIGTDQIDLKAALRRGVAVFNGPYGNTRSVAELVMGHVIALSRRVSFFNRRLHEGWWMKTAEGSREVRGKTLGLVGYGRIGTQVGILAEAMGMKVFYHDIKEVLPIGNVQPVKTLKELLKMCQFVSLHVPDTPLTHNLIGKRELQWMLRGSFLINTSRGSVVGLKALREALVKGHLSGAGVDVFLNEPSASKVRFVTELKGMEQVILTPHIAGSTQEAQKNIAVQVSKSVGDFLLHGISEGSVNFPPLRPPPTGDRKKYQRMINIHKNIPGVLGQINSAASGLKINIESQFLATHQDMGYLVMDVQKNHIQQLVKAVCGLKSSIRTAVL